MRDKSTLQEHRRHKKVLKPPFMAMSQDANWAPSFWIHERLPEMLWAALVFTACDQDEAFEYFNSLFAFLVDHAEKDKMGHLTLSGIAGLEEPVQSELLHHMLEYEGAQESLRELLRYDSLPMRSTWAEHLAPPQDIELLRTAVGNILWHQSEMATACRWVRVMGLIVIGNIQFAPQTKETAELIVNYPNGDLTKARPSIRASEIGLGEMPGTSQSNQWVEGFWRESWEQTACIPQELSDTLPKVDNLLTRAQVNDLHQRLIDHWGSTQPSTAPEAKHAAVFGMALYCLRIIDEMMGIGVSASTLGRMGLRTILEVNLNLTYLNQRDQPKLWAKWREYGAGQAKLNVLKFEDQLDPPDYVDLSSIEHIAFEEEGPEFLNINLGGWSGLDLRRISEKAGLKDLYDQHYPGNSGFVHGTWSGVSEAIWGTCANPLHRLHRIPTRKGLGETVDSAAELMDEILVQVDVAYPSFPWRLTAVPETDASEETP